MHFPVSLWWKAFPQPPIVALGDATFCGDSVANPTCMCFAHSPPSRWNSIVCISGVSKYLYSLPDEFAALISAPFPFFPFPQKFPYFILMCISTPSFQVISNGVGCLIHHLPKVEVSHSSVSSQLRDINYNEQTDYCLHKYQSVSTKTRSLTHFFTWTIWWVL